MDFKDQWDLDTALKIVQNEAVDSHLWAEAVEWLLLHGPPEIVSILLQASSHATRECFPELQSVNLGEDGEPVYDLAQLAETLEMSEDEVRLILSRKLGSIQQRHFFGSGGSETVH